MFAESDCYSLAPIIVQLITEACTDQNKWKPNEVVFSKFWLGWGTSVPPASSTSGSI